MKPRLLILSDLWGIEKSDWIKYYLEDLNSVFETKYYDCCELGEVNKIDFKEKNLHSQFVNGGIDIAVNKLLELEPEKVDILAFSIGGTIAWKAGLKGLNINNLYAVSSTRLRYETEKPNCHLKLVFGEKDNHKPSSDWFEKLGVEYEFIIDKEHQIYTEADCSKKICNEIKTNIL